MNMMTTPVANIKVTTKKRTDRTSTVLLQFGDDDPIVAGTLWHSIDGAYWSVDVAGERVSSRHKFSAVLYLAEAVGAAHFHGSLRYTYGAHSILSCV